MGEPAVTLMEISEDYRQAAVLVRVQLDEVRQALKTASEAEKPTLRQRETVLKRMLQEMRDLRELTARYYTAPRDRNLSSAGIRAGRLNSLK